MSQASPGSNEKAAELDEAFISAATADTPKTLSRTRCVHGPAVEDRALGVNAEVSPPVLNERERFSARSGQGVLVRISGSQRDPAAGTKAAGRAKLLGVARLHLLDRRGQLVKSQGNSQKPVSDAGVHPHSCLLTEAGGFLAIPLRIVPPVDERTSREMLISEHRIGFSVSHEFMVAING
jgi:hypothetical protein